MVRRTAATHRSDELIQRAASACLALPEVTMATEGSPALEHHARYAAVFRVGSRSFAWHLDNHHGDERVALWCRAAPAARDAMISSDPETFFVPPYVGRRGWVGARLDRAGIWDHVDDLVEQGYRLAAPPRLIATLGN